MPVIPSPPVEQSDLPNLLKRRRGRPRKMPITITKLSGRSVASRRAPRTHADYAPDSMLDAEFDDLPCEVEILLRFANQP